VSEVSDEDVTTYEETASVEFRLLLSSIYRPQERALTSICCRQSSQHCRPSVGRRVGPCHGGLNVAARLPQAPSPSLDWRLTDWCAT